MKNTATNLPPSLQAFASLLDIQPPEVQDAFRFLLATAMHEAGKFGLLNVAHCDPKHNGCDRSDRITDPDCHLWEEI